MRKDFIFHLGFRDPFGKELLKKYAWFHLIHC